MTAFHEQNYNKLYKSTLAKTWWLRNIYFELKSNKLKIDKNIENNIESLVDNPYSKLIIGIITILGLIITLISLN